MAKSLRSRKEKANKSRLRSNVFGPVENERKERLSAKLLELARNPPPEMDKKDVLASEKPGAEEPTNEGRPMSDQFVDDEQAMHLDGIKGPELKSRQKLQAGIYKRGRGKSKAAIVFPTYKNGKRVWPKSRRRYQK